MGTLVIGLDGATFDIALPLIETGRLPNLALLMARGAWGPLRSVMPPESPQAWSSFLTGNNPGRHGILGFTRRVVGRNDRELCTADHRAGLDISELLARQGMRAGLYNVPLTYPPRPTSGFVVAGMGTPGLDAEFVHPPALKTELLDAFGDALWVGSEILNKTPEEHLGALHTSIDRTMAIAEYLLQRFDDLDLFATVFMASDRVQHFFWNYVDAEHPGYVPDAPGELKEAINGIYEHLDQVVGGLVAGRDEWNIVVISDHGGGPFHTMVNLNRWLELEGYLCLKSAGSGASKSNGSPSAAGAVEGAYRLFSRHIRPALDRRRRDALRRLVPRRILARVRQYRTNPALARIDWAQTRAYAEGAYGRIFLNMVGPDAGGVVLAGGRETLLAEIEAKLLKLRDPRTDELVVDRVYRREELYGGPFVGQAPDLVVAWRGWRYHVRDSLASSDRVFSDPPRWQSGRLTHAGQHRPEGVLIMRGPAIQSGNVLEGARLVDVAPTLLYLVGASIPTGLDGRVLTEGLAVDALRDCPPRYEQHNRGSVGRPSETRLSPEDEASVWDHLRDLGYVE